MENIIDVKHELAMAKNKIQRQAERIEELEEMACSTTSEKMELVASKAKDLDLLAFHVKDGDFEMQGQFTAMAFRGKLDPSLLNENVDALQDLSDEERQLLQKKQEEELLFHSSSI